MPVVPIINQQISMDVPAAPQANAEGAYSYQALQQLGANVADSGFALADKVQAITDNDAAQTKYQQTKLDSEDKYRMLKIQSPDGLMRDKYGAPISKEGGGYRTVTDEFHDWANERYQQDQAALPTSRSQSIYKNQALSTLTATTAQIQNDALAMQVDAVSQNQDLRLRSVRDKLLDAPNVNEAYFGVDSQTLEINKSRGVLYDSATAQKKVVEAQEQISSSTIQGKITRILSEPKKGHTRKEAADEAMNILVGQDPDSVMRHKHGSLTISEMLKPEQKAQYEQEIARLSQVALKMDIGTTDQKVNDFHSLANLTESYEDLKSTAYQPLMRHLLQEFQAGQRDEYSFATKAGSLDAQLEFVKRKNDPAFLMMSPSEKTKYIRNSYTTLSRPYAELVDSGERDSEVLAGGTARESYINTLTKLASEQDSAIGKDMVKGFQVDPTIKAQTSKVSAVMMNPLLLGDPSYKGYLQARSYALVNRGSHFFGGFDKRERLLSEDETDSLGQAVKGARNYGDRVLMFQNLKAEDPVFYSTYINQAVKDKKLDPGYLFLQWSPSKEGMTAIARGIDEQSDARAQSKYASKLLASGITDPDKIVAENSKALINSTLHSYPDGTNTLELQGTLLNAVKSVALINYAGSEGSSNAISFKDAVIKANNMIFNQGARVVNMGREGQGFFESLLSSHPGENNFVRTPPEIQGKPVTDADAKNMSEYKNWLLRNPNNLKSTGAVPPIGFKGDYSKFAEQVRTTGSMVPVGNDYSKWMLQYRGENGNLETVYTDKVDRKGKPLPLIRPTEVIRAPTPPDVVEYGPAYIENAGPTGVIDSPAKKSGGK